MQRLTRVTLSIAVMMVVASAHAQTATYHLHKEASTITTTFDKLLTAGPDAASTALTTTLTSKAAGEYLIKEFETQTSVPSAAGIIPTGSTLSFNLWMRKTANVGTVFPRAKIRLNNASGTLFCTATGATALTTTVTNLSFSCATTANITMTATDRFYLWVGVNLTATSATAFSGEVDLEGTLNGNFDSQITLPLATGVPTVSSLTPNTGAIGSSIVIAGTNFRSAQGSSTVKFNGTVATPSTWSATSITAPVPTGATTGSVIVTVGGQSNTGVSFTVTPAPSITSLTPNTGAVGSSIVIAGSNFGPSQGNGSVTFNGTAAISITNWTTTSVTATVPAGATTGNVVVTAAGGVASPGVAFTVTSAPSITSLTPNSGAVGSSIVIVGSNFGPSQGNGGVKFNGLTAAVSGWTATSVAATVPSGTTTGNVVVTAAGGVASPGVAFTVTPAPSITSLTPNTGAVGSLIVIAGSNFGSSQGNGSVKFNGTAATSITNWTATSVTATVPSGAATGNVVVTAAGGVAGPGVSFTLTPAPSITSLSPNTGLVGSPVTIAGANFGPSQGNGTVTFNGTPATVTSWVAGSIATTVPAGTTTGNVVVTAAGGIASPGSLFTVTVPPSVSSLTPNAGAVGSSIVIAGSNFGGSQGTGNVKFNGTSATSITNWTASSVTAVVPAGATTGNVIVTAGNGASSAGVLFTVTGIPGISSLTPNTGAVGSSIVVAGTNFNVQGAGSTVKFNGVAATITNWTNGSITATVPASATTGNVVITADGGVPSAGVPFSVTPAPGISGLSPNTGAVGSSVIITGSNFGPSQGNGAVTFGGTSATNITGWSATQITATVPSSAITGNVVVTTAGGIASSGATFTVTAAPSISGISPNTGLVGAAVAVSGTNFGPSQRNGSVTFNGTTAPVTSWSATSIGVNVPSGASSGNVVVTAAGGIASNGSSFTVTALPVINSLTPSSGEPGASITIAGSNFTGTTGTVTFNGKAASVSSWANASIMAAVPNGATSGNVVVTAGSLSSSGSAFTVLAPTIASLTPASGAPGSSVTIAGTNLGTTAGTVTFNGQSAAVTNWSDSTIVVTVPGAATSGNVVVSNGGLQSAGLAFTVVPPISFSFYRQILIDHRQVANTDQSNFPVLVSATLADLATAANGGMVQNANGFDIVFTSDAAGQNKLDHEIDTYDPFTGSARFWVRIPLLSHTTDTSIYMWYGSNAVTVSQENKAGVWQAGYQSVFHFDGSGAFTTDSGSAGYGLSQSGIVGSVTGKISAGVSFDGGAGNYLSHGSVSAFPSGTSAVTLEGWIQSSGYANGEVFGYGSNSNTGARAAIYGDGNGTIMLEFDGLAVTGSYPNDSQWHHVVGVYGGGSSAKIYLDGTQLGSTANLGTPAVTTTELKIGGIPTVTSCCAFAGSVDEIRVVTGALSADWIATEYHNQNSPATFSILCAQAASGTQTPPCSVPIPPSSFAYSRPVVINHLQVANSDQTDFPVLVSGLFPYLANAVNDGQVQNAKGYDIAFTSDAAGQNQLDHEIDSYDPLTGNAGFWVRIPTLSHTADTTIYMRYGSSAVILSQENKAGVWRNGYAAVWHMGNGSTLSLADSTGVNNGIVSSVDAMPAKIGGGASFTRGTSSHLDIPNNAQLKPATALSLEAWIYPNSMGSWNSVFGLDYRADGTWTPPYLGYDLQSQNPASRMVFSVALNGSDIGVNGSQTIPLSQWTHVVGTYDGTTLRLYENGVADPATTAGTGSISYGSSRDITIGDDSIYQTCCRTPWNGLLDELRISSVARSADWIATEYHNQNAPASFDSIGQEIANFPSLNPVIAQLSPEIGRPGVAITISGSGFGETQGSGTVTFNGVAALVNRWSDGSIVATVPTNASTGPLAITTGQQTTTQIQYTILPPAALATVDIGSVSSAGSSSVNNGVYTVTTGGADVTGTADSATFLYQEWSGDFDVMVRVRSQQNTAPWAKAGLMVRESLSAASRNVFAFLTPTQGARLEWRLDTGATEADDPGVPTAQPFYWIRLMRRGNNFAGLGSPDGQQWFALGSKTVSMNSAVYVGIGQATAAAGSVNTATYDSYSAQSSAFTSGWIEGDIGSPATPGVSVFDGTSFFIHTTGQDVWNGTDPGEHFIYQPWSGDFDIKVHTAYQQNTGWAKLGVMARESLAANAANVMAYITPSSGSRMQWRLSTGVAEADEAGIPTAPVPSWVRLIRRGNNFSSYWSQDGSTWTILGAKTVNLASSVYLGLVATDYYTSWSADVADHLQVSVPTAPTALQSPWIETDIGSIPAGNSSFDGLSTVVLSAGTDIWNAFDQLHFIYQPVSGDLDVVSRVTYIENTGGFAKAGLMVRQSLDPGAPNFSTIDTFGAGARPQWRYTSGLNAYDTAPAPGATRPYWVRIVRRGNTFWSYGSTDGANWSLLATQNISMSGSVLVGVSVTPSVTGPTPLTNNSVFDNLALRATTLSAVPLVTSISPQTGGPLTQLTVSGSGFGTSAGSVQINGVPTTILGWSSGTITVAAPQPAPTGSVVVIAADGTISNSDVLFAGINPVVVSVNPSSGLPGDRVTVYGSGFGQQQGSLTFNGTTAPVLSWQNNHIVAYVPAGTQTGPVQATQSGVNSNNNINFTVVTPPAGSGVLYGYDPLGRLTSVVDASSNSGAVYNYDAVGNILSISRSTSGGAPAIISFSPAAAAPLAQVSIAGTNFSATASQNTVLFNGTAATVYRSSLTSLLVGVPVGATSGPITVTTTAGTATSSTSFSVTTNMPGPVINSFTPTVAFGGATITITGNNFDPVPANNHLIIAGWPVTPTNASTTSLTVRVPNQAGSGTITLSTPNGYAIAPGDFYSLPTGYGNYGASGVGYAARIGTSSTVTMPIQIPGKIGLLIFDGMAGHNIAVNTLASTFSNCNWQLFRPDGTPMNGGQGCTTFFAFLDAQPLPVTGTYTFVVAPSNTAGSATMQFFDSIDATGAVSADGTSATAVTTVPGQNAVFTLPVNASSHLIWNVTSTTFAADPGCTMAIYNLDGSRYSNLGTGGVLSCSSMGYQDLWYTGPAAYTLRVDPAGMSTGSVTFNLTNVPDVVGTISLNGGPTVLTTTIQGQNGFLTFAGTAGQQVSISGTVNLTGNANAFVSIQSMSDFSTLYSTNTPSTLPGGSVTLPATGTYRVWFDPSGLSTGNLTVTLTSP